MSAQELTVVQGFRRPQKKKKDGTPRKARQGWGPYRSVLNERSAAFNLTLDVQNLKQEVGSLTALRDILRSKALIQRQSPEGSLVQVVKQFYQVFRQGGQIPTRGGQIVHNQQCQFMHSVMDAEVDVGNGLCGPDIMMQQMVMYATVLRSVCLEMQSFDIVEAEDSVVIRTHATLHFQIQRETIEQVFPHVMGNEWLVRQLVGKEVEPNMGITFFFNAEGKCCKYAVDLDFVGAFISIVKDPMVVNMLLGRALIADNCMLGVIDESLETEEKPAALSSKFSQRPSAIHIQNLCLQAVENYYLAYATGIQVEDGNYARSTLQRDFLEHYGDKEEIAMRWRALSEGFQVQRFIQKAVISVRNEEHASTCIIRSAAKYKLLVTPATICYVFPHLVGQVSLSNALLGKELGVSSQIEFSVDTESGRIYRVKEHMNFATAMAKLIPNRRELQFVLSQAKLASDGPTSCPGERLNYRFEEHQPRNDSVAEQRRPPRRSMNMADILG